MHTQLDLTSKPRAMRAYELAHHHHHGITRKYSDEPYFAHPVRVAESLMVNGWVDEDTIATALLHDCHEDPDIDGEVMPLRFIEANCGARVARWVDLLSKQKGGNRAARNERYTARLVAAPVQVQAIKIMDIRDNVRDLATLDPKFAPVYLDEKEAQLRALSPAGASEEFWGMRRGALLAISDERNKLAIQALHMMQRIEAEREQEARDIDAFLAAETGNEYAEFALF